MELLIAGFFSSKKISVLLDDSNYLLWRQQVLLAVKAHKLQRFLDENHDPPTQFISDDSGGCCENPEFAHFEQQDSALASWLLSSISPSVLPHLIGMDTSAKIWKAVVALYGSKTTSKLMFYRRTLHSQRKGEMSMKDFLVKIKSCCDHLASCGEIISEHEHITAILNGLSPDYEFVITIVTSSQVPYTVQGVVSMLLDAEARQQLVSTEISSSANVVMAGSGPFTTPWFTSSQPQWNSSGWCFSTLPSSTWTNPCVGSPPQQVPMPSSGTAPTPPQ
ncbi:hypothetical protein Gotur_026642, partial [Gossypium turneri]